jgi:HemY protein
MIRVIFYLVVVGALAFGAVWLADRPGEVAITWQGQRVDTSVMVLVMAFGAVAVGAVLLWSIVRAIWRSPGLIAQHLSNRRGVRGYMAVSRGLIAVGSGDVRAARKLADEAARIAPNEPLTLLLSAQTAQLSGDRAGASRAFQQMSAREDTRLLGLHGQYIEARRRGDHAAALVHAEEAANSAAPPAWAGQAALEFRCAVGDWGPALERLDRNAKSGLVDKTAYRRQRAVLLTAQALTIEESERDRSKALVLEAAKLAPTLVPAAALAGRFLTDAGEGRKAARLIEAAWVWNPHPDLADVYANLKPGDSARERLSRIQALAAKAPAGNVEAALAVGRAALDAQEFAIAREALAPLIAAPTRRVAALMAELEERQHGDTGRAREWMTRALHARRDPAWTADGFVSDHWMPVSPVSGRLDAFEWKDPLAGEDAPPRAMIEAGGAGRVMLDAPRPEPAAPAAAAPVVAEKPPADMTRIPDEPMARRDERGPDDGGVPRGREPVTKRPGPLPDASPVPDKAKIETKIDAKPDKRIDVLPPLEEPSKPEPPQAASLHEDLRPRRARGQAPVPIPPALIPLVHAPDDPGPDPEAHVEPEPEAAVEPLPDSWSRIRQLFRQ